MHTSQELVHAASIDEDELGFNNSWLSEAAIENFEGRMFIKVRYTDKVLTQT